MAPGLKNLIKIIIKNIVLKPSFFTGPIKNIVLKPYLFIAFLSSAGVKKEALGEFRETQMKHLGKLKIQRKKKQHYHQAPLLSNHNKAFLTKIRPF